MKIFSGPFAAHLAQATTTVAEAWKVARRDGQVFGWTTHDVSLTIDGVLYRASEGLQTTAAHTTDDLRVDSIDVTAFMEITTEQELLAGLWDAAEVTNFWYNWGAPPSILDTNVNVVRYGNLGQVVRSAQAFTAQIRGLAQRFAIRIGRQYTPGCPWRHALWNGSTYVSSVECGLDLTSYIHTGSITAAGSPADRLFTDTASGQADGYFAEGLITMTSGDNAGITREVNVFIAEAFQLKRPFPYAVVFGDTYSAVKGDDKGFAACQAFGRHEFFGGFPDIPGFNAVYANVVEL